jgi:hypothetical protein
VGMSAVAALGNPVDLSPCQAVAIEILPEAPAPAPSPAHRPAPAISLPFRFALDEF